MFTRSTSPRSVAQRVRLLIASGLLALSLIGGVAGTAATVSAAPKQQPPPICVYYTQEETIIYFRFDPGPGGHWDCDYFPTSPPHA